MHREFSTWSDFALRTWAKPAGLLLLGVITISASGCKHGPDATTPKKAGALFAKALEAGDMAALRQVAMGTEGEFELAKGLGTETAAFNKFAAAASAKFGTDARTKDMTFDIGGRVESSEEKIDGETAQLVPEASDSGETEPLRLKKDGSNWKVDLSFLDRDATARGISERLPAIAAVLLQAAKEVDDGKFSTFSDAKAAVRTRVDIAASDEATGKLKIARNDITSLQYGLDLYKNDAAEYPQTQDGLLSLTQKPAIATNWHGPYLKATIANDPWGHPYIYVSPGVHNTSSFDLHSMGPDGKDGTGDDIQNWAAEPVKP